MTHGATRAHIATPILASVRSNIVSSLSSDGHLPTLNCLDTDRDSMNKARLLAGILGLAITSTFMGAQTYPAQSYPEAEISNGVLRAKIYLPDAQKGFYRGTRFDWAGVMGSLEYKGHNYYGPFFEKFDPEVSDVVIGDPILAGVASAASGPVEEFIGADGAALGYSSAKAGETFCKIGVGALRKPREPAYSSYTNYTIVDGGKRTLRTGPDWIEFTHQVDCGAGYAYRYTKTIRFLKHSAVMVIEDHLTNIGTKPIETQVYDHNFLSIDHEPTGPSVVMSFPFSPAPTKQLDALGQINGKELSFPRNLAGSDTFYAEFTGFKPVAADYQIRVENRHTGAGVLISCSQPLVNLGVWAVRTVVAPEPYIAINIPTNRDFRWKYTYKFYVDSSSKGTTK
jgi:hypothetical protein